MTQSHTAYTGITRIEWPVGQSLSFKMNKLESFSSDRVLLLDDTFRTILNQEVNLVEYSPTMGHGIVKPNIGPRHVFRVVKGLSKWCVE